MWYLVSAIVGGALWHMIRGVWDAGDFDRYREDILHAFASGVLEADMVRVEGVDPIDYETALELAHDWWLENHRPKAEAT